MQATSKKSPDLRSLTKRLESFVEQGCSAENVSSMERRVANFRKDPNRRRDALSTSLMKEYRDSGSKEAFALLYELNYNDFQRRIYHHLRRVYNPVDVADILQEVFFNVYRYPFNFKPNQSTAFRNWTHTIIRNTVLKHSRRAQRDRVLPIEVSEGESDETLLVDPVDEQVHTPCEISIEKEEADDLRRAWILYLHLYQEAFRCLAPREKRVLHLTEVEQLSYKEIAAQVGGRPENMKMIVFRARQKIYKVMKNKLAAVQDGLDRNAIDRSRSVLN